MKRTLRAAAAAEEASLRGRWREIINWLGRAEEEEEEEESLEWGENAFEKLVESIRKLPPLSVGSDAGHESVCLGKGRRGGKRGEQKVAGKVH